MVRLVQKEEKVLSKEFIEYLKNNTISEIALRAAIRIYSPDNIIAKKAYELCIKSDL